MRFPRIGSTSAALLAAVLAAGPVSAQTGGGGAPPPLPASSGEDASQAGQIVAEVDGRPIRLAEVGDAIRALPGGGGKNSFETLYPLVLQRLIEREAIVVRANAEGIADDPAVRRRARSAAERVVESEYLRRKIEPTIPETTLLARYDAEVKGRPGPDVVHVRAILVPTEDKAIDLIRALGAGADFAKLARESSKDSSAASGGDLGFVPRSGLSPEIGAVAFSMRPGEVTPYPVWTPAGWFVLKVEGRGRARTPSFAEARAGILAAMVREKAVGLAREVVGKAVVRVYPLGGNKDGQ